MCGQQSNAVCLENHRREVPTVSGTLTVKCRLFQELYQQYLDGEDVLSRRREEDPFWEPTEDVLVGTASVFLQSLSYALDFDDKLTITDYKGMEEGQLLVSITPCSQAGRPLDEDYFVEDPNELLKKPYHFKVAWLGWPICVVL